MSERVSFGWRGGGRRRQKGRIRAQHRAPFPSFTLRAPLASTRHPQRRKEVSTYRFPNSVELWCEKITREGGIQSRKRDEDGVKCDELGRISLELSWIGVCWVSGSFDSEVKTEGSRGESDEPPGTFYRLLVVWRKQQQRRE